MPTDLETDAIAVFRQFLLSQTDITNLTGTRIYGPSGIPRSEIDNMPQYAILLIPSGGPVDPMLPIRDPLIQVRCYGQAQASTAMLLGNTVNKVAHRAGNQAITFNSKTYALYRVHQIINWQFGREPDSDWPYVFSLYNVMVYEVKVA